MWQWTHLSHDSKCFLKPKLSSEWSLVQTSTHTPCVGFIPMHWWAKMSEYSFEQWCMKEEARVHTCSRSEYHYTCIWSNKKLRLVTPHTHTPIKLISEACLTAVVELTVSLALNTCHILLCLVPNIPCMAKYRIAGYFRRVLIFIIFMVNPGVTKFSLPRNLAIL